MTEGEVCAEVGWLSGDNQFQVWGIGIQVMVKSSQVTFIYIALLTIQIVTKQLHNIKMGK